MTETRYQLIFSGRLQPGTPPGQAQQAIKRRFKLNDAQLDRLFSGQPVVVKHSLDRGDAERYQRAFAAAGALVELEPAAASHAERPSMTAAPTAAASPPPEQPSPSAEASPNEASEPEPVTAAQDLDTDPEPPSDPKPEPGSGLDDGGLMQVLPPGAPIGEQSPEADRPPPDTSHLQLAPSEATSLEDCAPPPSAPPPLDLSGLELAPIDPTQQHK